MATFSGPFLQPRLCCISGCWPSPACQRDRYYEDEQVGKINLRIPLYLKFEATRGGAAWSLRRISRIQNGRTS